MFNSIKLSMKNFKLALIIVPLFIIAVLIQAYYSWKHKTKQIEEFNKEYPAITKDMEINGKITGIFRPDGFKNSAYGAYLIINASGKRSIHTSPYTNESYYLTKILAYQDSLSKKKGNDTIYLFKNNISKPYLFVLYEGEY